MANTADEGNRRKLLKQHRVYYDLNRRQAPGHEDYFGDIQLLGEHSFDKYRSDITIESRQKPWRQNILSRAKAISAKARRCLEANKNESSWRLSLESEILARFGVEIVWSELEVTLTSTESSLDDLAVRQKTRQSCRCPQRRLGEERFDEGLNPLFDDRAEEEINHEGEISKIFKIGKKPDRLLGLRVTRRLDRILNRTEGPQGKTIGDSITTCPFKNGCEPLLFPFLVLEAKSEKSAQPFSKINLQTGFAVRALLELQRKLLNATVENRQSGMMPLVWFLSNKGEIWRLSGAYVEETKVASEPNYRILELWEGNVTYEHQALRLLLILDYIFDWARDVYRKEIINSLLSLATNPTPSLAAETDIYSTVGHFIDINQMQESESESDNIPEQIQPFGVPQLLKFFDTRDFAFRDARYMRHKFCALHVTLENLDRFLYSVRSMNEAKQLARRLWKAIQGPNTWSVTAECLNAVEKLWTNQDRELQTFRSPEQPFLVCFAIKSYLSNGEYLFVDSDERPGQWDQIHELTYIAIAHDALQALKDKTQFKPRSLKIRPQDCPKVPQNRVVDLFEPIRFASVRKCFAAAISRARLCSHASKSSHDEQYSYAACVEANSVVSYFVPSLTQSDDSEFSVSGLPWVMYKHLKVGMMEPSESFLQVSQQVSKHDTDKTPPKQALGWTGWDSKLQDVNAVLVAGVDTWDIKDRGRDELVRHCIFVLDPPPTTGNDKSDGVIGPKAFSRVLQALLNIRGLRNHKRNFPYEEWHRNDDLQVAPMILEHISTQYQLVQSLNPHELPEGQLDWLSKKQKLLRSWEKATWPYSFEDSVNGIKHFGELYEFGQTLHHLMTAFQAAVKKGIEISRLRMEMKSLKRLISDSRKEIEGAIATGIAGATNSAISQPPPDRPCKADSLELIVSDKPANGVDYKRKRTLTSRETDTKDSEEPEAKRPRIQDGHNRI